MLGPNCPAGHEKDSWAFAGFGARGWGPNMPTFKASKENKKVQHASGGFKLVKDVPWDAEEANPRIYAQGSLLCLFHAAATTDFGEPMH